MTIQITKAQQEDAKALMQVSKAAFNNDVNYEAPGVGGPPGYASANWHLRMILTCDVYKIVAGHFDKLSDRSDRPSGHIVGGIIVYEKGYRHMELGRIWIHPDYQDQGIGKQAIQFLEETYPEVKLWELDTPAWNKRNIHFYQKMGYELTGTEGPGGLCFAKQMV
jgi:ribosomal protein S18 acetylase RimI-like enzyme